MKKLIALALSALLLFALLTGCAQKEAEPAAAEPAQPAAEAPAEAPADEEASAAEPAEEPAEEPAPAEPALPDGVYTAEFNTDSSMFHANEACDGKGTLTVKDGSMTIHVSLASKSIVNLFYGLAEDAQKDGAELLQPTTDTVTYSDGLSDEVYGFDIPVPALDTEFDVALIGKKGVWYDHKVSVTDPVPAAEAGKTVQDLGLADGVYTAELTFAGGSGKAQVFSPCTLTVQEHDRMIGYVSQLCHAIAVSLMCANDNTSLCEYTGDSFRDLTRIARINDKMWAELFLWNKENLISEIDQFSGALNEMRNALVADDREKLEEMFRLSTQRRAAFDKKAP